MSSERCCREGISRGKTRFLIKFNCSPCEVLFHHLVQNANSYLLHIDSLNHPKARLEIHSSENIDANKFLFKGSLTIKSITNPIEMKGKVQKFGSGYSADIKLVFDRSKYDVRHRSASFFNDLGDRIISDEVFLNVKIKLNKNVS